MLPRQRHCFDSEVNTNGHLIAVKIWRDGQAAFAQLVHTVIRHVEHVALSQGASEVDTQDRSVTPRVRKRKQRGVRAPGAPVQICLPTSRQASANSKDRIGVDYGSVKSAPVGNGALEREVESGVPDLFGNAPSTAPCTWSGAFNPVTDGPMLRMYCGPP